MLGPIGRVAQGVAAGCAGIVALEVASYADQYLKGRAASKTPTQLGEGIAERAGLELGEGRKRTNRASALGPMAGYADGVPLAASNSGEVLIRGKACPIIGRVSMDYLTVDLNGCPAARVGDEVVLVGRSGRREITIEDWARDKQTHPYEIICSLGPRVERAYR